MNPHHIVLVQQSFATVTPDAERIADLFYARLFQLDLSLRLLFPNEMREQKRKLMLMLTLTVESLENPAVLTPTLCALGRRHANYRVELRHYETVGTALLWTLQKGLGEEFTPDMREAWAALYALMTGIMQDAVVI